MRVKFLLLAALGAVLAVASVPAGAASGYHMNGQGSINLGGTGLPACLPGAEIPDCTTADVTMDWQDLTVQGLGVLQNAEVAGQYTCASQRTGTGVAFQSKIKGNTSNFVLTFNFRCTKDAGSIGPSFINGWFSNATGSQSTPYQSVDGHPHPAPVGPGMFAFKGFFKTTDTHPYNIDASNGAPMTCGGGFAPTNMNGTKILSVAFVGHCNAAQA